MAPIRNAGLLFNSIPKDYPVPGETTIYDTTAHIDLDNVPLNGGFLAKTLILSIDPYLRGRMRGNQGKRSYIGAYEIGKPLSTWGIAVVLRSETPAVDVGKYIMGVLIGWVSFFCLSLRGHVLTLTFRVCSESSEYAVYPPSSVPWLSFVNKHPSLNLTTYVGAAGMPGHTAYAGWKEHSHAKAGETVFVTTGAGPVGSFVIQLAKQAGCKVIGSAGSEAKLAFMKSIGADVVFNYKDVDTRAILAQEGPIDMQVPTHGIVTFVRSRLPCEDRYWDNVGGDVLDAAIEHAAIDARIILCGSISGYNTGQTPIKNLPLAIGKSLHLHGILVTNIFPKHAAAFWADIPTKLATGEIKYIEDITRGLENAGEVILSVQKGRNMGKAVVVVADE
ncbi:NAD(P)-binding protein [Mycena chlorophos]|uniref:NAD(P)-binding protein n=1 Tax=Mycena chlorophos TaxID=658473 RepID=A0A8H6TL26_MYCCL|nr:NAD(P)-binding protein [Mycena chlorophos]